MKKLFLALLALLLVPTLARAQRVSISELHEQTEAMGRWSRTYDTPNGAVEVDVPVLVPDEDACPVLTVEIAKPLSEELFAWITSGRQTGGELDPRFEVEIDGALCELMLCRNGYGATTAYEEVKSLALERGDVSYYATPTTRHYPWQIDFGEPFARDTDMTVDKAMAIWREHIALCYPDAEYTIAPKRVYVYGSTLTENTGTDKYAKRRGYYTIVAEQLMGGFPVFGAIASLDGHNNYHIGYADSLEANRLNPYRQGAFWGCANLLEISSSDGENYMIDTALDRVRTVEYADVPLAPLDEVIAGIEKEIEAGHVQRVFSLRLGYLLYSNPDMTDYAWAVPRWVLDCFYVTDENKDMVASFHEHDTEGELTIWTTPEFTQLPIDAQSGEPILFTAGDEETFSVPEIILWEDER